MFCSIIKASALAIRKTTSPGRGSLRAVSLHGALFLAAAILLPSPTTAQAAPPVINPFGPRPSTTIDTFPGYVLLSDGSVHPGHIHLTRDKRLKIVDAEMQRQREVPLRVVQQIECTVKREWMEKEWKFKELASSEKMFTGRSYPAREYLHIITLHDGRTITGPLSGIIYLQPDPALAHVALTDGKPSAPTVGLRLRPKEVRYLLHKRNKGELGATLKTSVYVKRIKLGDDALEEGRKLAAAKAKATEAKATGTRATGTRATGTRATGTRATGAAASQNRVLRRSASSKRK